MTIPEQAEKLVDDLIQAARDHEKAQSYETKYTAPELEAERKKVIAALVGVQRPEDVARRIIADSLAVTDDARGRVICDQVALRKNIAEALAALPHTGQPQEGLGDCGPETIQTLLGLLNPLHGDLDRQLFDERRKSSASEMDIPRDAEYSVNITEGQERDLTQAVLILEDRKRAALSTAPASPQRAEGEWQPIETCNDRWRLSWLYTPAANLSTLPGQEDDVRLAQPANWCWATMWMPAHIPAPPVIAEPSTDHERE